MTVHTILQVVCLFIIYTVLTVVLPELVFHQKYKGRRTGERLMLDITVSNFYIMNLVFILQLLHISSIYTLLIFTVMPVFAVIIIQYRKAFKAWGIRQLALLGKISSKTMGIKTFFAIVFTRIKDILCNACKNIFHIIGRHKTEYVLFTLLSVWLLYMYGSNEILQYGYTVSDLPVHNYWINEMSKNNIFAAGVYPFGFHCIIYYIHTVFHIDTYVILRLFPWCRPFICIWFCLPLSAAYAVLPLPPMVDCFYIWFHHYTTATVRSVLSALCRRNTACCLSCRVFTFYSHFLRI